MLIRASALAALLLSGTVAVAQECPVPQGADPKLAAVGAAARLAYLRSTLDQEEKSASTWRWSWVSAYSVLAVGQLAFAGAVSTRDQQPGLYVGGVASAIAMVPLLVLPLEVVRDAPEFDAKISGWGPEHTCELITEGEKTLMQDAHNEARGASWVMHIVNILYNTVVTVIIGAGYHNWTNGVISGGVGALIGEAMILSQPTALTGAWQRYQSGAITPDTPKLTFGPAPGSFMALSGTF
jgi:hypothetical protein